MHQAGLKRATPKVWADNYTATAVLPQPRQVMLKPRHATAAYRRIVLAMVDMYARYDP